MADASSAISARAAESSGFFANGGASALAETTLWLMLVVGLILLLAWLAKRFGGMHFRHHGSMRVVSVLPLGNREKIVLVQTGDKYLLLGVTPSQINTLQVFDEMPRDITAANAETDGSGNNQSPFQQLLRFALNQRDSSAANTSGKGL